MAEIRKISFEKLVAAKSLMNEPKKKHKNKKTNKKSTEQITTAALSAKSKCITTT